VVVVVTPTVVEPDGVGAASVVRLDEVDPGALDSTTGSEAQAAARAATERRRVRARLTAEER
jgi:hypothetical protein